MQALDFSLRLVRPSFVAGAEEEEVSVMDPLYLSSGKKELRVPYRRIGPRGDGLRVPSLRGVLRFWFRALVGDSITTAELRDAEGEWLGSTEHGQGLRLIPLLGKTWRPETIDVKDDGLAYLGYGPLGFVHKKRQHPVSSHNKIAWRDAIPAGTVFNFKAVGTDKQLEVLTDVLQLIHLFGGIGSRSRRGWGSLSVLLDGKLILSRSETAARIQDFLARSIARLDTQYDWRGRPKLPPFTAFSNHTQIRLCTGPDGRCFQDAESAHRLLGKILRGCRAYDIQSREKSSPIGLKDHDNERADFSSEKFTNLPLRLSFGAPYQVKLNKPPKGELRYVRPKNNEYELFRRASPLILKILECRPAEYIGMALYLKSKYFPCSGDVRLQIKKEGEREFTVVSGWQSPPTDDSAITNFLEQLQPLNI